MEPQHPPPHSRNPHHPHLHAVIPPSANFLQSSDSTPMTSPGLFSPSNPRPRSAFPAHASSDSNTPSLETSSPYLHPLQHRKVRETHKALIDSDSITGRKLINQYEVIEEIGRGMHGKVKLARNLETGENVAIKIIPRYSKRRRLGKVMAMSPQEKTMREIAILKKMRHPNVVSLLEIIDDPELKKIYLILEHVELGEVIWRKKGLPHICLYERRRIERESRGEPATPEEEQYDLLMERRFALKELKRAKMSHANMGAHDFWSIEHGVYDDASYGSSSRVPSKDDLGTLDRVGTDGSLPNSLAASRATSRAPSRSQSIRSMNNPGYDLDAVDLEDDMETPGPLRSSNPGSATALDGTMYGPYIEEAALRGRSPSMADSIISHMSSVDWNSRMHDPFAEDFSYVPCFTLEQARSTFRDTVLGLEYLHYQGVVHRDIKPANLLWTKDHRVKISDFGVSYFGRPIRDGEPDDETVSESEAQDFDDDLELAKTVGTPAFFAPELCYTDADRMEQPRISEMIDIWSLGVTLYCLVYARIPFQAEDEWRMFKKIATEDVFIPRKRLKPVDPSTPPNSESLFKRHNVPPYRDDNELAYEEIDNLLYDLLRQMFTRNPEKRIRLRDIKRHPWVVQGIPNPIAWIDDTDPARPSQGRRVQVNDKETAHAVVPIAFLERARSTVKKITGKLMHPLGDRSDSKSSRRRAASSAASSAGDSMYNVPPTPHSREARRKSLKGDDYFSNVRDFAMGTERGLSSNQSATSYESPYDPLATAVAQPALGQGAALLHALHHFSRSHDDSRTNSGTASPSDQSTMAGTSLTYRPYQRVSQSPSNGNSFLTLTAGLPQVKTLPPTPYADNTTDDPLKDLRKTRGLEGLTEEALRSRSVDRGLFASTDKRAPAHVGVNTAVAPGTLHRIPSRPRPVRSVDLGKAKQGGNGLSSPLFFSSRSVTGYQHGQPQSDSNIYENQRANADLEERPQTAHRIEHVRDVPEARTPPPRQYNTSTPESFARARDEQHRKHIEEYQLQLAQKAVDDARLDLEPSEVPCPGSPDDELFGTPPPPSREDTMETRQSSRSASIAGLASPLTSPSDVNSPVSSTNQPSKEEMLAFQSDPSLPALLSGSSSVSADLDAEPLVEPGVISTRALLETTDSLTPPAFAKEPIAGFPLEHFEQHTASFGHHNSGGFDVLRMTPSPVNRNLAPPPHRTPELRPQQDDDDDDSDSDEGLVMAKTKKKKSVNPTTERVPFGARRRDTNISIASTETAKKVVVHGEEVITYVD
ncbi:serine threonine-protein kinase ssp1 [Colletotrichum sojae]|uniref:non-specific serine/threonine protein kinase n=1 Tax=Colletotrichum sojae TaxID=2175907 RepID=A0A8H6MYC7_9PEZI|nr:serine threonine-protein kinase ssp1 [Colletotrichum sojae]